MPQDSRHDHDGRAPRDGRGALGGEPDRFVGGFRQAGSCPTPRVYCTRRGRRSHVCGPRAVGGCDLRKARCKSRRCPSCGVLWAGDTRRKLLVNISAYGKAVALVTTTGPGAEVLPWDMAECTTAARCKCSGKRCCRVVPARATEWNGQAPASWTAAHKRAASRARYNARKDGGSWRLVAKEWEFQKRGVLHVQRGRPDGDGARPKVLADLRPDAA